jgi:hypothetical protein
MAQMTSPDRDRLRRILDRVRQDVPDLRLVDKRTVWWMRALGVVVRPFAPDFATGWTTVIGRTVYLPRAPEEMEPARLAATLAHEYVHQLDQGAHPTWFYVSYLFLPLPVWRTRRAYWERRAYAVDMMLALEIGGEARLALVEAHLRRVFGGPAYGWMWGGRQAAASYLKPVADAVRAGRLQREEPYRALLSAWRGDQLG